ncbi:hypothetical protein SKAU_G00039950 [Synaphobranchus kaupii]|uniref:Uncharacterized protein n=1 Tax=Synaphobranchus kaupii TaxID=118154 RepID=A0A9Q1JHL4_SYNKA|nr:hypothetical protein SKAU_G00039950 [Synaphobranchus kaupii]
MNLKHQNSESYSEAIGNYVQHRTNLSTGKKRSEKMSGGEVVCAGWLRKSPPEKKLRRYHSVCLIRRPDNLVSLPRDLILGPELEFGCHFRRPYLLLLAVIDWVSSYRGGTDTFPKFGPELYLDFVLINEPDLAQAERVVSAEGNWNWKRLKEC